MKNLRKQFPVTSHSTYLNTAATGLLSEKVFEYLQDQNLELLTLGSLFRDKKSNLMAEVRERLAGFFSAEANKIALVPNFSFGFNILLEGLEKETKFLLIKEDYPSINLAVESRNFPICYAEISQNLEENIYNAIKENKPDVFAFSIVQYISGIKLSQSFLKQLKKDFPALIIIADGTQFCGTEKINFKDLGIDVLGASAYKWMNAGFGHAFFLFHENVPNKIYPKTKGFGSNIGKYKQEENAFIGKFEPGHLDTSAIGSILSAIDLIESLGISTIEEQLKKLSELAKNAFAELNLLSNVVKSRKNHSTIFNIKGDEKLFQHLLDHNIICSQRGEGIRISFHYYNTAEDLEKLIDILKRF
ncbi:aminotransferase class V-fold PLP-dependent enzyme [Mesonia maritima]|uniref:Selenocysteine lyase/cysteine desulfurase n=1 Tax=Mesonia maritima TaxID=1793873 RepID=A0ABU1K8Q3_9FLAO|nr:aminotransferase class V-fold PLP-dependent enzyme [Mesonia maritima]MDR6301976.1 selenocysteine lyase/cysteine desulfurase [Mesonia maritima]